LLAHAQNLAQLALRRQANVRRIKNERRPVVGHVVGKSQQARQPHEGVAIEAT
jgi:hypothetical protein